MLLSLPAAFPVGAFPLPELCRRLTEATGVTHGADGRLRDYPVFVSVHGGDPKRVESLVASALGGEWQQDGKTLVLTPMRPKAGEGLAEFERQFRRATAGRSYLPALPLRDLYGMAPGSQARFGAPFRPFAQGFVEKGRIVVRRDAYGAFEFREEFGDRKSGVFTPGGQLQFASLPPAVAARLGDDAKKPGLTKEEGRAAFKSVEDPSGLKVDWRTLDRTDPIAVLNEPVLAKVAGSVATDLVAALPDLTLMNLPGASGGPTVEAALGAYAATVEWRVEDGAVLGALPECERLAPAQARRSVLSRFVQDARRVGVPTSDDLSAYLAEQRPGASETWGDMMTIAMAGVVVDQSYLGDHPYNLRFERSLTPADWRLLRGGKAFSAAALDPVAQAALTSLLLDGRSRLESGKPDPAAWPSLAPDRIVVLPELVEEDVVIAYGGFVAEVETPRDTFARYPGRKEGLGREPLYQLARRRRVKLRIAPQGLEESVETGFGEVTPVPGSKPVPWVELPESIRKAAGNGVEATPPPVVP